MWKNALAYILALSLLAIIVSFWTSSWHITLVVWGFVSIILSPLIVLGCLLIVGNSKPISLFAKKKVRMKKLYFS
ncbi:hypothetical protein C1E23_01615 [Pseudoalteromonas phenolica]|uniref:Uncharacterized protein n=1 Tax=Pseudoalteromonas phenolica TaxID=161398 RepID=A0A4Q7ISB4_9GAMM|nr:hypothetical protein C1E23_01615 [Pseudoalteromonas phenolica]